MLLAAADTPAANPAVLLPQGPRQCASTEFAWPRFYETSRTTASPWGRQPGPQLTGPPPPRSKAQPAALGPRGLRSDPPQAPQPTPDPRPASSAARPRERAPRAISQILAHLQRPQLGLRAAPLGIALRGIDGLDSHPPGDLDNRHQLHSASHTAPPASTSRGLRQMRPQKKKKKKHSAAVPQRRPHWKLCTDSPR